MLLGDAAMKKLASSRVAVFGVGGVGGYAAEALARSGVGALDLIDNDKISVTNINRQIYAVQSTLGQYKVDVAAERISQINPDAKVRTYKIFYTPETAGEFDFSVYDYIIDAIDTVAGKIAIAVNAFTYGIPAISSMGAGNKLDPTMFEVSDIYKTSVCPLARVMRHELRKRGVKNLKVVYSKEAPITPIPCETYSEEGYGKNDSSEAVQNSEKRRGIPGSVAFVPSVAGLIIAGEAVKELIGYCK